MRHRVAVLVLVAATAATGWLPFAGALGTHLLATAAFLLVVRGVLAGRYRPSWLEAVAVTLLLRAVCLPHPPSLSDDVYRYLHEGRLVLAGYSPYAMAPAETPEELRGPYFDRINNPEIPAAYPPAVQYALALGVWLWPGPLGMKLLFGLLDWLVFVALWRWLPRLGLPAERALVYGLCPLLAVEFAGQGHSDSLAVLFTVLALSAVSGGGHGRGAASLAVATAGKLLPAVLLPSALRGAARPGRTLAVFAVVLVLLWAPFFAAPGELFRGTLEYTARWRSNDTLFALLHAAAEGVVATGWLDGSGRWLAEPQRLAKIPLALLALAVLAWSWRRRHPPERTAFVFFAFFVACAPTVHPWYLAFLLPLWCVYPSLWLLAFTGTVFLAYHVLPGWQAHGRWEEVWWVKAVEYAPFYAGVYGVRHLCLGMDARVHSEEKVSDTVTAPR